MSQQPQIIHPQTALGDEIDLAELFAKVWSRKWWVVAITAMATVLAVLYLQLAKPVYQAEVYLMQAERSGLEALNIDAPYLKNKLLPQDAYREVLNQLASKRQRRAFFDEQKLYQYYSGSAETTREKAFEAFEKALSIKKPKKGEVVFTSISLEGPDQERVARHLNAFVERVYVKVAQDQVDNLFEARDRNVDLLEQQVSSKRRLAEQRRQDRIVLLQEARMVAEASGLKTLAATERAAGNSISIVNESALFMRGTDTLEAEVRALEARKSDDPFIEGLRDLQEGIENLKAIRVDLQSIKPVQIDAPAFKPEKPIKPKKLLIVIAAVMLGGILGLFVALVVPARKDEDSL